MAFPMELESLIAQGRFIIKRDNEALVEERDRQMSILEGKRRDRQKMKNNNMVIVAKRQHKIEFGE